MARLKVQAKGTVQSYWIAVDDKDVEIRQGEGVTADLSPGDHIVLWHTQGAAGASLGFTFLDGARSVCEVKESKIPSGYSQGGGARRFSL